MFRTEAVRSFTPYHLPPLIQQLITATTYNINHRDFNNDSNDCATSLLCYHFAKCFQRSSWEIRCKYERAVGAFYKESYGWWDWCWRNWTGCETSDLVEILLMCSKFFPPSFSCIFFTARVARRLSIEIDLLFQCLWRRLHLRFTFICIRLSVRIEPTQIVLPKVLLLIPLLLVVENFC